MMNITKTHTEILARVRAMHVDPTQAVLDIETVCYEIDIITRGEVPEKPIDLVKLVETYEETFYADHVSTVALLLFIAREKASRKVVKLEKAIRDEIEA